jgi:hypothetical protein
MDNGIVLLSVSFNWMDILAAGMTGLGGGGLGQGLLQLLELYGCQQSRNSPCRNRKPSFP